MKIKIETCTRCGETHPELEFKLFTRPIVYVNPPLYYWAMCPVTNEPICSRLVPQTNLPAPGATIGEIIPDPRQPQCAHIVDGMPRRCRVDLQVPAERAIMLAIDTVEQAGAHQFLTEAVTLLGAAKDKVSDFVEITPA